MSRFVALFVTVLREIEVVVGCLLFSWYECDLTNTHGEAAPPRDKAQATAIILAEYYI